MFCQQYFSLSVIRKDSRLCPAASDALGTLDVTVQTWLARAFVHRPGVVWASIYQLSASGRRPTLHGCHFEEVVLPFFLAYLVQCHSPASICYYRLYIILTSPTMYCKTRGKKRVNLDHLISQDWHLIGPE